MNRLACMLLLALTVASCASAPPQGDGSPPWSSLTSPTAALRVALEEVCLPAILEDRPIGPLAEARYLRAVAPRSTGSPQATAAWRLGSWHEVFVMQLPNGGCSLSLEAGDAEALASEAQSMLLARAQFTQGQSLPSADGNAINTAWCTPEPHRPVVAGIVKRTGGRRVALLINVFRAQDARPEFCQT